MPLRLGGPELIIILLIVVVLFGAGRISRVGGELGTAIRSFKKGLEGNEEAKTGEDEKPRQV
jgi:sec-independent protein translocase protein TatA